MPAPAVLAAIAAIAGLAQAGGQVMGAMSANDEARKRRRQESAWHDEDIVQRGFENKIAQQRLGLEADQAAQQRPMNAINMISGLEDLKTKRQKSGSYLETIRALGR
jgi:hypothetical protein